MVRVPGLDLLPEKDRKKFLTWLTSTINNQLEVSKDRIYTPTDIVNMLPPGVKGAGRGANDLIPTARLVRSTDQSIPNSTWTSISWGSALWNTDLMWVSGAPTLLTFKTPGRFSLWSSVAFTSESTGARYCRFLNTDTTTVIGGAPMVKSVALDGTGTGNYIEIEVGNGANADILPGKSVAVQVYQSVTPSAALNVQAIAGATKIANLYREV